VTIAWSPDNRKVDKVGFGDGAAKPDGKNDVVLVVEFDGPATALFVSSVTDKGEPTGDYQADTLVGNQALPNELSLVGANGKESPGLFVFDADKLQNATDGSLKALSSGHHKLTLNFADSDAIKEGVRLYIQSPDGSVSRSPVLR
jgi:hypothetical protein